MNILLVSEPGVDGVFRYVENLVQHLLARGLRVHLAYSDRRGGEALQHLVALVEREGGRTLNLRVDQHPGPADFAALLSLRSLVRELRPDLIHAHSAKAGALVRLLPFVGAGGMPLVYQPHAYIGMRPRRGRADRLYDGIERLLGRWSTTIACSYDEQAHALRHLRLPPFRVLAVPNGVDTTRFVPASPRRRRELRAAFGLPLASPILGAMSRCSAQKDPLALYRGFSTASARRPDLVLFHVGQGDLDPELRSFIAAHRLAHRVIRRPYLSSPAEFYQVVDGFALTSRYEGLSLSLLEALSADLPLIVTDAPGNGDLLHRPLSHLWRVPVGDHAAIADAILDWVHGLSDPQSPRSNHRDVARACYDQARALERVLALYRRLQSPGPHPGRVPVAARA
jgi:glycosyltransferase involved in cell wall biosynthesis